MTFPVILGLDFGGSKIAAAVSGTDGERLGESVQPIRAGRSAAEILTGGIYAARALLDEVAPGRPLVAVGACTFGIPHDDRVDLAPNIAGWEGLSFGATLRDAFPGAALRLATDVKAAAWAEVEDGALAGADPALYVNLGTGFAVALVVGGAVVSGRHMASGEIGYNLRTPRLPHDVDRLEDVVSGKALETAAIRLLGRPDVAALFENAGSDPAAKAVCRQFRTELCFHLVNLTIALDPQRIAVGGGLLGVWTHLEPALSEALASAVPFPPELVVAAHPHDAPLLGALALARAAVPLVPYRDVISEGAPA